MHTGAGTQQQSGLAERSAEASLAGTLPEDGQAPSPDQRASRNPSEAEQPGLAAGLETRAADRVNLRGESDSRPSNMPLNNHKHAAAEQNASPEGEEAADGPSRVSTRDFSEPLGEHSMDIDGAVESLKRHHGERIGQDINLPLMCGASVVTNCGVQALSLMIWS